MTQSRKFYCWLCLLVGLALLSACSQAGSEPMEVPQGDAGVGRILLREYGCGYCHVIPGVTEAEGLVGPPLNDFSDREFIAGTLENNPSNLIKWIMDPREIEPATTMPDLGVSERDANDMAAYLLSLQRRDPIGSFIRSVTRDRSRRTPAQTGRAPDPNQDTTTAEGALIIAGGELYGRYCTQCHGFSGEGMRGTYPRLIESPILNNEDPTEAIEIILNHPGDLAFETQLNNQQLAAIISYVRNAWSNNAPVVSGDEVGAFMPAPVEAITGTETITGTVPMTGTETAPAP